MDESYGIDNVRITQSSFRSSTTCKNCPVGKIESQSQLRYVTIARLVDIRMKKEKQYAKSANEADGRDSGQSSCTWCGAGMYILDHSTTESEHLVGGCDVAQMESTGTEQDNFCKQCNAGTYQMLQLLVMQAN